MAWLGQVWTDHNDESLCLLMLIFYAALFISMLVIHPFSLVSFVTFQSSIRDKLLCFALLLLVAVEKGNTCSPITFLPRG
jgi:hypothetical protein